MDLLTELQGIWRFTCDRCSGRVVIDLSPSDIGVLLRGQSIDIACTTCQDPAPFPFVLSTIQYKFGNLSLKDLLALWVVRLREKNCVIPVVEAKG